MSNISTFFPKRLQGTALGLNAGIGNFGVTDVQIVIPLVMTVGLFGALAGDPLIIGRGWASSRSGSRTPRSLGCCGSRRVDPRWLGMNDIASAKASSPISSSSSGTGTPGHALLYIGTFGSFIGFAAGFPLLMKSQFPHVNAMQFAWLGPLVGATVRPFGGWLSDKLGGSIVTRVIVVMALGVAVGYVLCRPMRRSGRSSTSPASWRCSSSCSSPAASATVRPSA